MISKRMQGFVDAAMKKYQRLSTDIFTRFHKTVVKSRGIFLTNI